MALFPTGGVAPEFPFRILGRVRVSEVKPHLLMVRFPLGPGIVEARIFIFGEGDCLNANELVLPDCASGKARHTQLVLPGPIEGEEKAKWPYRMESQNSNWKAQKLISRTSRGLANRQEERPENK